MEDKDFWNKICRSFNPRQELLGYINDNLHKDEEKVKKLLLTAPSFAYDVLHAILELYPKYCMYVPLKFWEYSTCDFCIIDIKRKDVDVDRVLEIMWHTQENDTIHFSLASFDWIRAHPWLVAAAPLESFPIRGHTWYAFFNWEILEEWMPPNAEDIIEEQEIVRRISGGTPYREVVGR